MFGYIFYGLIAAITLGYLYVKNKFKYWDVRQVCHIPPTSIMGNLNGVGSSIHLSERIGDVYEKFKDSGAPFFGLYLLTMPIVVITDLDLCRNIFVRDFNSFHDRGVYMNEVDDPLSGHLFSLPGLKWKNMRNKLSPTFTSGKIKQMFSTITAVSDDFMDYVRRISKSGEPLDVKKMCVRYTGDVIGSCAFGLELNALKEDDSKIIKVSEQIFNPDGWQNFKFLFINSFQNLAKRLHLTLFPKDVTEFFMEMIRQTVDQREQSKINRNDFINILIHIKNEGIVTADEDGGGQREVGKITFNELAAQAFVFFFAGFETSSTAMNFCLFELSRNSDIQEKVRDEILSVLEKYDGKMTYEAINEMTYLEQVVNETLRRYPSVPFQMRIANDHYKIEGTKYVIEKGTQVFIPTRAFQNDENIFPDPEKFDPDRFSPENSKGRHPYAFLPFGEGPRVCIGMRFALVQVKVGLASLISKFSFTLNDKTKVPIRLEPTNPNVAALGGIWLNVHEL